MTYRKTIRKHKKDYEEVNQTQLENPDFHFWGSLRARTGLPLHTDQDSLANQPSIYTTETVVSLFGSRDSASPHKPHDA